MNERERARYSRQILFAPLGEEGQQRLLASRAVVVGCGALGSFHVDALARSGVGEIRVIDRDYVEESNLQRQWLFDEADAAQALPKSVAAQRKIAAVASSIRIDAVVEDLHAGNAESLLSGFNVILDGTDNFETRYLINDFAIKHKTPWIYGAAVGSYGLVMPVLPGRGACLRCVFRDPPEGPHESCDTAGVLNAVTAWTASLQVADAIKLLSGNADAVRLNLTSNDVWRGEARSISVDRPSPDCPCCVQGLYASLEARGRRREAILCGRDAVQIPSDGRTLVLEDLRKKLEPLGEVRANQYALRFYSPPHEITVFSDGRAIIKGAAKVEIARSLYARYVGG